MQRIILGTLAAAALAAALTGCDASFSASPSSANNSTNPSTSTQNGSPHNSGPNRGGGTSTGTGSGNGASGIRHCTTSDFNVSVYSSGDPGAGQRYATLQLENHSRTACTTGGWAGLGLVNANGALPTKVIREGSAKTITIPAGASAYEELHYGVVPGEGENGAQCEPTAKAVHIIPPNQTTYLSASWVGSPVCQHGQIRLTPIKLGKL
ncbi:DUF4232 domain-containing protein [Actinomadura verrucosospora]|uniref:DUF4232 domain-containing protein n=1 Tax=Actinomadura verrucosospora TaxID=46165 RepID=A0A7D4AMK7_ACTVE|nr:DUF4232 domain-containing protein [Actinomadura verrucosospora]QKG22148.1 hypothetical protein ACTIVE_3786 [Actinomadura verrucosospora]